MKKKKTLSFKEILELTSHLSKSQIRKINTNYAQTNDTKIDKTVEKMVLVDLQQRIIDLKLDNFCPKCGSK